MCGVREASQGVGILRASILTRSVSPFCHCQARRAFLEKARTDARTALGDEAFAPAWAEGRALTLRQAIALAQSENGEEN